MSKILVSFAFIPGPLQAPSRDQADSDEYIDWCWLSEISECCCPIFVAHVTHSDLFWSGLITLILSIRHSHLIISHSQEKKEKSRVFRIWKLDNFWKIHYNFEIIAHYSIQSAEFYYNFRKILKEIINHILRFYIVFFLKFINKNIFFLECKILWKTPTLNVVCNTWYYCESALL